MNVFIHAIVRIFSFAKRLNVPFNSAITSFNGTFKLSPRGNILTCNYTHKYLLLYTICCQACRSLNAYQFKSLNNL